MTQPVAEIVLGLAPLPAEVRGLIPPVAGGSERRDDDFVVVLHRLRRAFQGRPVGVGEAGAGLGLELVVADVVGPQAQGLVEVVAQADLVLTRNPKHQVEVEVLDSSLAQHPHRAPHRLWLWRGRSSVSSSSRVKLCAPSETRVTPPSTNT